MVVGELTQEREVVIIGGGPGGYHAAIRAAQLGKQVTIIEKNLLGGVCLNEGCIPSKVFTHAAGQLKSIPSLKNLGIDIPEPSFNILGLQQHKQQTMNQLRKGIEALCKSNSVEIIKGDAMFLASNKIGVENGHQYDTYKFEQAIIATGSKRLPKIENLLTSNRIVVGTDIYLLEEIPTELIVYGSDRTALEIAFTFSSFGSKVVLLMEEGKSDFSFDSSINRELTRLLKKNKVKVYPSTTIIEAQPGSSSTHIVFNTNGKGEELFCSHLYVSTVAKPNLDDLGIERAGILLDENGLYIETNKQCQTNVNDIYAIGDVTKGEALAVKAIKQGKVAAETIAGKSSEVDLTFLPNVVHSVPPIATVGFTEEEAINKGYNVKTSQFPLASNGYATITNQKEGFVKIVSEEDTDLLLGVHMIGTGSVELISAGVLSLEMVGREEDLAFPLYPHPSFNESMLESIEDLTGMAIHKPPSKQREKVNA
ncbi:MULTISPECIES: dihydrolipoyl dehydrogenase [Bacillus]|uniref:dihydrolipoyl dehydrogenase n=1 Tax=Bacillus TaxID=1386 RepID=UPI000BB8893C|nr:MULTISPECIES: dihydrolipoyl dehydrogenase [Bacillus]